MQIVNVCEENKEQIKKFLESIRTIEKLDEKLIDSGVAIFNNDEVVGYITYEEFCEYGLIRYFIFQKSIDIVIIKEMFEELKNVARKNEINTFITIGKTIDVINLFKNFGFEEIKFENLIVNNKKVNIENFKESVLLKLNINND